MIKRFVVTKLSGLWSVDLALHPDINILTGRNGAGKTTVLKLLWFMMSGNLQRIVPEIRFDEAEVETTKFSLRLKLVEKERLMLMHVELNIHGKPQITKQVTYRSPYVDQQFPELNHEISQASCGSIFFPTFRRIEGGFSTSANASRNPSQRFRREGMLQEAMAELADDLSYEKHRFVSSISTIDIESLLTQQFAETAQAVNKLQTDLSGKIEETIKGFNEQDSPSLPESLTAARAILSKIQEEVRGTGEKRSMLLQPFTVLERLLAEVLKHKGIRVKDVTTFGDVSSAMEAGHLSAGEKQMFSFLCYNAFCRENTIFIDEPEISLHVDWQRILFSKLVEQGGDNQFIVATHSPFIYTKFVDREHQLDAKGEGDE